MKTKLAAVGLGLGLLAVLSGRAIAQIQTVPDGAELRREIQELRRTIDQLSRRLEVLESIERHRVRVEVQPEGRQLPDGSYLRFPIEIERAMMAPPNFRPGHMDRLDFAPMSPDTIQRGVFDPGVPGPLDVPKLRP